MRHLERAGRAGVGAGQPDRGAPLLAEALRLRRETGLLADVYLDLLWVIEMVQDVGYGEAAACLLGAEDAYCTSLGFVGVGTGVLLRREPTRQALQEQLGESQFKQAWDAGRALSIEEAIDGALLLTDELATKQY